MNPNYTNGGDRIRRRALEIGFSKVGIAPASKLCAEGERLAEWLQRSYHGEMSWMLRDLEHRPDHWFAALRTITGADPVAPEDRGRMERMAAAWVSWGREHGYTW